jgi:hypothetical protein
VAQPLLQIRQHNPGLQPGLPLGLPGDAKTVRVDEGSTMIVDGLYVDTKGAVGAYIGFAADGLDAAIELASRIPAARLAGAIAVRPVGIY